MLLASYFVVGIAHFSSDFGSFSQKPDSNVFIPVPPLKLGFQSPDPRAAACHHSLQLVVDLVFSLAKVL